MFPSSPLLTLKIYTFDLSDYALPINQSILNWWLDVGSLAWIIQEVRRAYHVEAQGIQPFIVIYCSLKEGQGVRAIDVYSKYIFTSDGDLQRVLERETETVRLEEEEVRVNGAGRKEL
ncbi:MAG: hypothetical protein MMC33_008270 [Icmadophila ericetorum]|nr:hypothetical protein [Icmadophila ericetorum]